MPTYGAPTMQPTGNPQWDSAFGSLANAFGADPSKPAEAYYYGSKAREAQLNSNNTIDAQNWRARFMQGVYNRDNPAATPAPAAPTYDTPTNVPGAAPIVAPPSNLPMSQVVAPGGPQGPGGGALVQPTATPGQAADQITTTLVKNAPRLTQGTPPPMSPPSAVSPPAPTTTTTNGQSPNNDTVSGVFHPDSLNTTGGGQQYAAKAQANGSPAQVPFNLGTFSATGAAAGFNAQQMDQMGAATLASLFQKGVIDENMYHQMLGGAGSTAFGVQDSAARSAKTVANIGAASAGNVANINARSALAVADAAPEFVRDPSNPDVGRVVSHGAIRAAGPAGIPAGNQMTAQTQQQQLGAVGNYVDLRDPNKIIPAQAGDALKRGLVPAELVTLPGVTGPEAYQQSQVNYANDQALYPRPQPGNVPLGITEPIAFGPNAQSAIANREALLRQTVPRLRANPTEAHREAIQTLTAEHVLPTVAEINAKRVDPRTKVTSLGFAGDDRITPYQPPGEDNASDHMLIEIAPQAPPSAGAAAPAQGAAAPAAEAPAQGAAAPAQGTLSPVFARAPTPGAPVAPTQTAPAQAPAYRRQDVAAAAPGPVAPAASAAAGPVAPAPTIPAVSTQAAAAAPTVTAQAAPVQQPQQAPGVAIAQAAPISAVFNRGPVRPAPNFLPPQDATQAVSPVFNRAPQRPAAVTPKLGPAQRAARLAAAPLGAAPAGATEGQTVYRPHTRIPVGTVHNGQVYPLN